jgi:ElaB/YqjD/DUF883 family membrane-anchored ribosome-binding protein
MTDQSDTTSVDDSPREQSEGAAEASSGGAEATLARQIDELEEFVREHPLATIGIAAGIGLVAGLALSRR